MTNMHVHVDESKKVLAKWKWRVQAKKNAEKTTTDYLFFMTMMQD